MASLKPRIRPPSGDFSKIKQNIKKMELRTVCQESHCPNQAECWSGGTATFIVMGSVCTRACKFCQVKTFHKGEPLDSGEPKRLAAAVKGLDYVVITSVDRDDLEDQGAGHFASCVREVKRENPRILVEILIPDFSGDKELVKKVVRARPDVIGHNIETIKRLQQPVRDPRAGYEQSLSVLETVKKIGPKIFTKSSIMLGLGEKGGEVLEAMHDLRGRGVDILTLGQYLRPSKKHLPVKEFVPEEKWNHFKVMGEELGFLYVASGPLVRSSYRAGELFLKNVFSNKN